MYWLGDCMKKILILLFGLLLIPIQINGTNSIFIFGYTSIEVPYKADLNPYFDKVYQSIQLKPGYSDPNFSVEDENDGFFKSVINSNRLQTYRLKYRAYSPKYYQEETRFVEFIIVDKEPPKVLHSKPITVLLQGDKPDYLSYIQATDNETKQEDLVIEYNDMYVDYKTIGLYEVIYTIKDNSLNQAMHASYVEVVDKIKPTIQTTQLDTHQIGFTFFIEDYFLIKDNYDPNPTITYTIEGSLDEVGYALIHVEVIDSSNNTSTLTKRIKVVDNIPPSLSLTQSNLTIHVFSDPLDLFDYIDHIGKNLTKENLFIEENIDYETVGVYEVIYTLKDHHHNETIKTLTIKVIDKEPPIIKASDLTIDLKDTLNLNEGVYVEDNYSKNLKATIYETNYKHVPGKYYVIYEVVDEAGNHTYHERVIIVRGKTPTQNLYLYAVILVGVSLVVVGGFILYKKRKTL